MLLSHQVGIVFLKQVLLNVFQRRPRLVDGKELVKVV